MLDKLKTVIMGGTYNPVHIGHMHLADEVCSLLKPERFFIIPSFISAHKRDADAVSPEHRVRMLEIACRNTNYIIETCEIDREGVSYSIDTVRYLCKKYGLDAAPGLIIGDDLLEGFDHWKGSEALAAETELIVANRSGDKPIDFKYEYREIENLRLEISSSDIRTRLQEGRACRYLLPAGVYEYILENGLYGA